MGIGLVVKATSWIPAHRRTELRRFASRSHQVVVVAVIVGAITGLFVAGFERLVVDVMYRHILELRPWAIAFIPAFGLIAAVLSRKIISPGTDAATADEYLHSFHDRRYPLRWRPFAARTVAAVTTLGCGVPMGLEGPSMYAGATVGSNIQRKLPRTFRDADRRVLLVAGAAAGVAAIFKAPATGAVFAIEVPYQDDVARRMLLPALVASATGYLTFVAINGTGALFPIDGTPEFSIRDLLGAMGVGVVAGVVARGFSWMLRRAKRLSSIRRPYLLALISGAALAAMFAAARVLTGQSLLVGPGYDVVVWASETRHSAWILVAILCLRCAATTAAVAGGRVRRTVHPTCRRWCPHRVSDRASRGRHRRPELVHRHRRRRVPRCRISCATCRGDVRGRDDRPPVVHRSRSPRLGRRRTGDGRGLDHKASADVRPQTN